MARVIGGGKVTIPSTVEELLGIMVGGYVRLEVVEVFRRGECPQARLFYSRVHALRPLCP